jgi:hypothetical protein
VYAHHLSCAGRVSHVAGVVNRACGCRFGVSIRKATPEGVVTTIAGQVGNSGYMDGPGASAIFGYINIYSLCVDSKESSLYVVDL